MVAANSTACKIKPSSLPPGSGARWQVTDETWRSGVREAARGIIRLWQRREQARILGMTPQKVLDHFYLLSPAEKTKFIRLLGHVSSSQSVYAMFEELHPIDRQEFLDLAFQELAGQFMPFAIQHAIRIARERPDLSDADFEKELRAAVKRSTDTFSREIGEREAAKLKAARDRKPSLSIAERNVEICDLRRKDPRHWSQGRLAKKYKLDVRTIRKILTEENEWRATLVRGRTN